MRRALTGMILSLTMLGSSPAAAAPLFIAGVETGLCKPSAVEFHDHFCTGLFTGIRFAPMDLQLSATWLGSFPNETNSSAHVRISTLSLLAVPHIQLPHRWAIDFIGGVSTWHAEADISNHWIGTDDGQSLTAGVGVAWNVVRLIDLRLRFQHYHSVTGANINAALFGVNFIFGHEANL